MGAGAGRIGVCSLFAAALLLALDTLADLGVGAASSSPSPPSLFAAAAAFLALRFPPRGPLAVVVPVGGVGPPLPELVPVPPPFGPPGPPELRLLLGVEFPLEVELELDE